MKCKRCLQDIDQSKLIDSNLEGPKEGCWNCTGQTWIDINTPVVNPDNPREIKREALKNLKRVLQEFGLQQPIVLNTKAGRENIIVGGHQRLQAWKDLGMKTIWVQYVDLPKEKEHILNVAFNNDHIQGTWDEEKLRQILEDIKNSQYDVTLTGFPEQKVTDITEMTEEELEAAEEETPVEPEHPVSTTGEVWILGEHRLMVGDSTNPEDVAKLMRDEKGDAVWIDPPYGVSYKGTNNPNGKAWDVLVNDDLRDDVLYSKLLLPIFTNLATYTKDTPALYSCYASINHTIFERALNAAGWRVKQVLIWEKGHVLGHSDYHWSHEPILYAVKQDKNCNWYGDRTHRTVFLTSKWEDIEDLKKEELLAILKKIRQDSDLLSVKKDAATEYLHSTQKPVQLPKVCIQNSTRPREMVLDFCGGSGSTLIACQSTNRICRIMEIDPKYADVILTRWANHTKGNPIREADGVSWSELQARRTS